ncbi:MAG: hypothetical protein ACOC1O_01915 [bacterium]
MNKIAIIIYTQEEMLDLIITNKEYDLSKKEFRELKYKKIHPTGNLYLRDNNYSLYDTKKGLVGVNSSKSLYTAYKEKYIDIYPQRKINTVRDLKNFIKDIAEKENDKDLHKQAKEKAFKLSREYLNEIEKGEMFIYKDNKFKPKGSD